MCLMASLEPTSYQFHLPFPLQVPSDPQPGQPVSFVGVYDGHGGSATAEWLKNKLFNVVKVRVWCRRIQLRGWGRGGQKGKGVSSATAEWLKNELFNVMKVRVWCR